MKNVNRVFSNVILVYGRMLLTIIISLYSTRLVLQALGETDFGIFQLIAGVIAFLSFLHFAMGSSIQRFLSFFKGRNDIEAQRQIFKTSLVIHAVVGVVLLIILEASAYMMFDGFLNIPPERVDLSKTIFHWMSLTFLFKILSVPFNGVLLARENIFWIAIIDLMESILRLVVAIIIFDLDQEFRLYWYGIGIALIGVVNFVMFAAFCFKKYPECRVDSSVKISNQFIKEMVSFTGWNLFVTLSGLGRTQGLALVLNSFFGAKINSAYGIANQVSSKLTFFSTSVFRAINPQIMRSEGANDRPRMIWLSMIASKFGFFLFSIFAIPAIFEMDRILEFWLGKVPDKSVIFCQLVLVGLLIKQLTVGLTSAAQAVGKIKFIQSVVGLVLLANLPIAYYLLVKENPAEVVLISFIVIEIVALVLRVTIIPKIIGLSMNEFFQRVFLREIFPVVVMILTCYVMVSYFDSPSRFVVTFVVSGILYSLSIYYFGLCRDERDILIKLQRGLWNKLQKMRK